MDRYKIILVVFILPALVFMAPDEEGHSSGLVDFIGKAVNFVILFGGLAYLLHKPIRSFLEKRAREIEVSLEKTEQSKKEAERMQKEIEARLAGLEDEIRKILEEAESEGRRNKEKTLKLAQQERERIKHFSRQEIDAVIRSGVRDLRKHVAFLATALAEEKIKKKMSPETQSLLIEKSIERLGQLDEKSDSGQKIHPGTG